MADKLKRKFRIEIAEKGTHLLYVLEESKEKNIEKARDKVHEYVHCFNCIQNEIPKKTGYKESITHRHDSPSFFVIFSF